MGKPRSAPRFSSLNRPHTFAARLVALLLGMGGKGRDTGGMSGGARCGSGRKRTKPGPTRKDKRLAKQARAAVTAAAVARMSDGELCAKLVKEAQQNRALCGPNSWREKTVTSARVVAAKAAAMKESAAEAMASAHAAKRGPLHDFFKPLSA